MSLPDRDFADLRLTEWTSCGGCAAKWGASLLTDLVRDMPGGADPSLLVGLARLHTDLPKLGLSDGNFNSALRSQLVAHPSIPSSCLRWTGYLTDALRDSLQEWTVSGKESMPSLESIVPNLMERLRPIAFV